MMTLVTALVFLTITEGAACCSRCKAPLQVFVLVSAKIVSGEKKSESGSLHAIVRADVCVGCGTCVPVCPEPGAILMVNKRA